MAYKCYYHVSSASAADFISKLYTYIEAMGWVKEKGIELADAAAWQNSHAYSQGDIVKPTTGNGFVYICSTAGTSDGSEPTWGTTQKGETTSSAAKFRAYNIGRVYSSQGESDAEPKNYIYLYASGDTVIGFLIGLIGLAQWVTSTWLCGLMSAYYSPVIAYGITANPCYSYIYGNKDLVVLCTAYNSSYYHSEFGFLTPVWTQRTVLTSPATAGSGVNLEVASSADVHVGQWLQMWGATEEGRDKVIVSAVPDITHITVTTLPRNYSSGSWIGVIPVRALVLPSQPGAVVSGYHYMSLDRVGTEQDAYPYGQYIAVSQLQLGGGPDYRLQKNLLRPVFFTIDTVYQTITGVGGYLPTDIILQQFKVCTSLDLFLVYEGYVYPVSGTATGGGATTLTDAGKTMTPNAWADYILVITAGIGVGQTRCIISNTDTEFTVNAWETEPDSTSTYAVVDEAWRTLGTGAVNCPVLKEVL
jgi:hypothetical protein